MRMRELIYMVAEAKKVTFAETSLTTSDIIFIKEDQYAILYLKQSKTNTEHIKIQIILATIGKRIYSIAALQRLFKVNLCSPNTPPFGPYFAIFSRQYIVKISKQCIWVVNLLESNYFSYNFRIKAV